MVRATAHFFLLGAAILLVKGLASGAGAPEPWPLTVTVPAGASEAEERELVDGAILVEEALRTGWLRTDPAIRLRLVRNMRFLDAEGAEGATEEAALFERALALGMHRTDPVVRRRLIERAERALEQADLRRRPPTEADLRAHLEAHPERFARGAMVRLSQVFLSRQRRGEALEVDALALGRRLLVESPDPEEAYRLGDPFALAPPPGLIELEALERRLGTGFGAALRRAPLGEWTGPIASAYGLHFVWLQELEPGEVPALEDVRDQVLRSLRHDRRALVRAEHLRRLRPFYRITLERDEGAR